MAGARNGPSVAAAEAVAAVSTKPSIKLKLNLTILIIDLYKTASLARGELYQLWPFHGRQSIIWRTPMKVRVRALSDTHVDGLMDARVVVV